MKSLPSSDDVGPKARLRNLLARVSGSPVKAFLSEKAARSRLRYLRALDIVARLLSGDQRDGDAFPWEKLTADDLRSARTVLEDQYAPASVNLCLSAVRGVVRAAWASKLVTSEVKERVQAVPNIKHQTVPVGRILKLSEIHKLLSTAHRAGTIGRRDAAMLAVFYGAGIRLEELANLKRKDYDEKTGELKVHGKGGKERIVYVTNGAAKYVRDWLAVRGDTAGVLFCRTNKKEPMPGHSISTVRIGMICKERARAAKVEPFSPHDMRRSHATRLLEEGADVFAVKRLMGHANVQTTLRYDRRDANSNKKAAELLHVPYGAKSAG